MSNLSFAAYVDAPGWSDTLTVTQSYDYTSPDGKTTVTGTATFTFPRLRLADQLANPKMPCADYGFLTQETYDPDTGDVSTPLDGQFLAVSLAIGSMPGWVVLFGAQPTQAGAFTVTTDPGGGKPPIVTQRDADCSLSATCTLAAPGRRIGNQDSLTLLYPLSRDTLGLNFGVGEGDAVDPASFDVSLVEPGVAADASRQQAAIPPVYRVSLPTDANLLTKFSLLVNGGETSGFVDPYVGTGLPGFLTGALGELGYSTSQFVIEPLSPWACDVQMANDGDTLGAGKLAYVKTQPLDSSLTVYPGGSKAIKTPFPMAGQSFELSDAASGLKVTVQF